MSAAPPALLARLAVLPEAPHQADALINEVLRSRIGAMRWGTLPHSLDILQQPFHLTGKRCNLQMGGEQP